MNADLAITGRVLVGREIEEATVAVRDGTIVSVGPPVAAHLRVELPDDEVLLPGLVDTHVHVNDPGRAEWEGFWTATRAAAAGGITTLVDMPLNSLPPTTTVDNLRTKQEVAAAKAHIDVGFWGGALPDNVKDLRPLHEAGVFGFKAFLSPSGVDEFPPLDLDQLAAVAGVSKFHFARCFEATYGETPIRYLTRRRAEHVAGAFRVARAAAGRHFHHEWSARRAVHLESAQCVGDVAALAGIARAVVVAVDTDPGAGVVRRRC